MSRYSRELAEDVAGLIKSAWPEAVPEDVNEVILFDLANKFADLFAADNPPTCVACGALCATQRAVYPCHAGRDHKWIGGFDRDKFLAACGLEPD